MTLGDAERLFAVLGAYVNVTVTWRGGQLDRLMDERHADICRGYAEFLRSLGWDVLAEATYSIYGERGSVDLLAWHAQTRTLLVIEVKSELVSAEETLRRHDAKVRLGRQIGRERFGVAPLRVASLLVLAETMTNRRRVARLGALLDGAYPVRGDTVRRWLRQPDGDLSGLVFSNTGRTGTRSRIAGPSRVQKSSLTAAGRRR